MNQPASDVRDFGIAVVNARRVDETWKELWGLLASRPLIEGDVHHSRFSSTYRNDAGQIVHDLEGEHYHNTQFVASYLIGQAVVEKKLPIWLRLADVEVLADSNAFHGIDNRTWTKGYFRSHSIHKSNIEWRPLWVKNNDWRGFVTSLMQERYGEDYTHVSAHSTLNTPLRWTEDQMTQAILACGISNRDAAWRQIFKAESHLHGWTGENFRDHWSTARGTKGISGRPRQ